MNFLAYRTDSTTPVRVLFDINGTRTKLNGSVFDGYTDLVVEITTNPTGHAPGRLVVLKREAAEQLGLGHAHTIVRAVVRPVGEFADAQPGGMFNGTWLEASDSRWPFETPVPVHDRFEG